MLRVGGGQEEEVGSVVAVMGMVEAVEEASAGEGVTAVLEAVGMAMAGVPRKYAFGC